jgi:hypothetical protein
LDLPGTFNLLSSTLHLQVSAHSPLFSSLLGTSFQQSIV